MTTRDIPPAQWIEFLDRFSREHRAWFATIDRCEASSSGQSPPREKRLDAVVAEVSAGELTDIEIRFQDDPQTSRSIRINAPKNVRVDEARQGVAQGLEIVDDHDRCTRIRFRAAPASETLDGIAPGELPSR